MGVEVAVLATAVAASSVYQADQSAHQRRLASQAADAAKIDNQRAYVKATQEKQANREQAAVKSIRNRNRVLGLGGAPAYTGKTLMGSGDGLGGSGTPAVGATPTDGGKAAILGG